MYVGSIKELLSWKCVAAAELLVMKFGDKTYAKQDVQVTKENNAPMHGTDTSSKHAVGNEQNIPRMIVDFLKNQSNGM